MKIILGADHAGFALKERVKKYLDRKGIAFEDLGTHSKKSTDYPDYAFKVAKKVVRAKGSRGILICGTGTGMVIAANKIKGVRAVASTDNYSAKMSRNDNDTNILGLRGRFSSWEKTRKLISVWINTPFSGKKRHKRRINKMDRRGTSA
ncbi:MAG: ribose 5-phosphate isomerase B [Candidatus Diapherotrites archaeon]|uniref:Ribose 5-phosphate isomerase B n=1 Tax=Candidatus Iainarchaeum sp. TaxID=3101447 RepID=A0A2D6M1V3_9ARCH|nr:ribose 5-phosphate isomerase B [Candidatus Diapherotrites archaeon]|tara:strand:- start:2437 stop:2883 length:447 start_codon:yes stop_codon:yes gene_type:complete